MCHHLHRLGLVGLLFALIAGAFPADAIPNLSVTPSSIDQMEPGRITVTVTSLQTNAVRLSLIVDIDADGKRDRTVL